MMKSNILFLFFVLFLSCGAFSQVNKKITGIAHAGAGYSFLYIELNGVIGDNLMNSKFIIYIDANGNHIAEPGEIVKIFDLFDSVPFCQPGGCDGSQTCTLLFSIEDLTSEILDNLVVLLIEDIAGSITIHHSVAVNQVGAAVTGVYGGVAFSALPTLNSSGDPVFMTSVSDPDNSLELMGEILNGTVVNTFWEETDGSNNTPGTCNEIIYTGPFDPSLLPVELGEFSARADQNGGFVELIWSTLSEIKFDFFEVERSTDGERFVTVGSSVGSGNNPGGSNYSFRDEQPKDGDNYYRLKIIDIDGSYEYSDVVSAKFDYFVEMYPTFVTTGNEIITCNFTGENVDQGNILVVSNSRGETIQTVEVAGSSATFQLGGSQYASSFYVVSLWKAGHLLAHKKIVLIKA
ncbi:MAG: hypothetical protein ACI83D_000244 [Planctomycetota bacterium]|jgi:hypothetical protein